MDKEVREILEEIVNGDGEIISDVTFNGHVICKFCFADTADGEKHKDDCIVSKAKKLLEGAQ